MEGKIFQLELGNGTILTITLQDKKERAREDAAPDACDSSLDAQIASVLTKLGLSPHRKGYVYLCQAVALYLEHGPAPVSITKDIYPPLAKRHDTASFNIERAMRHAIERIWLTGGQGLFSELTHSDLNERPTNSQFIALLAEYFRMFSQPRARERNSCVGCSVNLR